jgi:O-antigen/teichoic acid export membrane protein
VPLRRITQLWRSGIPVLALAYGASAVANLLLSLVVGRTRGAAALGDFALAVASARTFYAATDFGVPTHLMRLLARDRDQTSTAASAFVTLRALLVVAGIGLTVVIGLATGRSQPLLFATVSGALGLVSIQAVFEAVLLSHQRQRAVAGLTTLTAVAITTASAAWWGAHASVGTFGAFYLAAAALATVVWWATTARQLGARIELRTDRAAWRRELSTSWPIGASTLLGIAALRFPVLLLGSFVPREQVGTFAAVDTVVTAAGILQVAVSNATLPGLAKAHRNDAAEFQRLFWRSNALLAVIGLVVAAGLSLFGERALTLLFPSRDFSGLGALLAVMSWSTPALLLVHHNIYLCAAADRERLNLRLMLVWFAIIATAELILVPTHGVLGAAWGVLVGRTLGLVVIGYAVWSTTLRRRTS